MTRQDAGQVLAEHDYRGTVLTDEEKNRLEAVWSRSGKRLIVSLYKTQPFDALSQIEVRPDQVQELIDFLTETLPEATP